MDQDKSMIIQFETEKGGIYQIDCEDRTWTLHYSDEQRLRENVIKLQGRLVHIPKVHIHQESEFMARRQDNSVYFFKTGKVKWVKRMKRAEVQLDGPAKVA